jgi:general stress protein 26
MAHRIVWCAVATVGADGRPHTRVLHPIWEWDGSDLTGWIATSPLSPKAKDLAAQPAISLTYWAPNHDTCSADCDTSWDSSDEALAAGWDRFANGPAPVGYDPSIGILRLTPTWLRVMAGTVMLKGEGQVLTWRA